MEKTGFYCKKCNSIPLIQIVPKELDIKIFCMCKCHKTLINYDIFMKNYYKTNLNYSNISNEPIYKDYIDPNPRYYNNTQKELNLEKINSDFNYIKDKISEYNLEIKTKIVELLKNKINEIEKIYERNKLNNMKLENMIKILISNYESNNCNSSNIKNLLYNKNFNMGYKNETYSTLNFDNKYLGLESLLKNVLQYLKSNFILSSYNEQLYTINTFFNHQKDATCAVEIGPEILASSSKDNYIILYNLEKKKSIYKYKAHNDGVNWILNINKNNIISCGGDNALKVWPKIDVKNLELINSERNNVSGYTEEITINYISCFEFREPILKIIKIDNHLICGCSLKNVYLLNYEIIKDDIYEDKKDENEKDIKNINFNILETLSLEKICDLIHIKNRKNEDLIVVYGANKIYFLSLPHLNLLSEIKILGDDKQRNCITPINKDEILIANRYSLNIININNFQIKVKMNRPKNTTFISKLRDNTLIFGTKDGIKRINLKDFEEIALINKIYSTQHYPDLPEIFNYVYEFSDNIRFAICSSYGNIKICKFKIG